MESECRAGIWAPASCMVRNEVDYSILFSELSVNASSYFLFMDVKIKIIDCRGLKNHKCTLKMIQNDEKHEKQDD